MDHRRVLGALILAVCAVPVIRGQEDQLATADSSRIETVVSPDALAKLLATATGSISAGVSTPLVLAPTGGKRSKRKPLSRFRSNGESKFRPKSNTEPPETSDETSFVTSLPLTTSSRAKFTGFPKRSRPIIQKTRFKLRPDSSQVQDIQPTPLPVQDLKPQPTAKVPLLLTNEINREDVDKTKEALFEQLRSQASLITGAQPVGVTRDIKPAPVQLKAKAQAPAPARRTTQTPRASIREERSNRREHGRQLRLGPSSRRREEESFDGRRVRQEDVYVDEDEQYDEYGDERLVQEQTRVVDLPARRKNIRPSGSRRSGAETVRLGNRRAQVDTVENYRYQNEDGSITWGYQNEDGSFKEETIGIDCITHGKYGYVDPDGEVREYSYTSGNRCDPETRKVAAAQSESRSSKHGYFDHARNNFVMPNGKRVRVIVNQGNKARGRRY